MRNFKRGIQLSQSYSISKYVKPKETCVKIMCKEKASNAVNTSVDAEKQFKKVVLKKKQQASNVRNLRRQKTLHKARQKENWNHRHQFLKRA